MEVTLLVDTDSDNSVCTERMNIERHYEENTVCITLHNPYRKISVDLNKLIAILNLLKDN